jgi:transcriptional regulator with XRE-family HTH domain
VPTPPVSPRVAAWRTTFGDRLRAARERRGLSQEALAEKAGVDRKLIYRTELGQTSPRLDAVMQIAEALGVQPSTLLPKLPDDTSDQRT